MGLLTRIGANHYSGNPINRRCHYDQENTITGSLNQVRNLTGDVVVISLSECYTRPPRQASLTTEAVVNKHYGVITLPTMCTGTTEMVDLRNRGVQCYGIGPAIDRGGRLGLWCSKRSVADCDFGA